MVLNRSCKEQDTSSMEVWNYIPMFVNEFNVSTVVCVVVVVILVA